MSAMTFIRERQKLVDTALRLTTAGLNRGTAGNLSLRLSDDAFLITPTGVPAGDMKAADTVVMELDGQWRGERLPSSEWRFHRDLYKARPEVGGVVHTHAPFCTTLACLRRSIPSFHYMIAVAGGDDIRCAPYATFGTQALSDLALEALTDRRACLLANHGMIAVGRDLTAAYALAVTVEELAEQYWRALQLGEPALLPPEEIAVVLEKFKTYGEEAERARREEG